MENELKVSIAESRSEKEEVYWLRYQVYVNEMKKRISNSDEINKMLYDEYDESATILYVHDGSKIVGTMRNNIGMFNDFSSFHSEAFFFKKFQDFCPESPIISLTSKAFILPEYRGSAAFYLLITRMYGIFRERNIQFDFASVSPLLINLYEKIGYIRYKDNYVDSDLGLLVPLVLVIEDIEHFKFISSPLYRLSRKLHNLPYAKNWLYKNFPETSSFFNTSLLDTIDVEEIIEKKYSLPINKIAVFNTLSRKEIQVLLKYSGILKFRKDDVIIRKEDMGYYGIYILLNGEIQMRKPSFSGWNTLAVLKPGDQFGEITYLSRCPPPCNVIASSDCEILVISSEYLDKKLAVTNPSIYKQILRNISHSCRIIEHYSL